MVAVLIIAGVVLVINSRNHTPTAPRDIAPTVPPPMAHSYPELNLDDPARSYTTLHYVAETGGDPSTRQQAMIWLDEQARTLQPFTAEQETWLLALLEKGGHPDWDIEYTLALFNSAFNVLHLSGNPAPLTKILFDLAAHHPHRTMRLYALQHIHSQLATNRLPQTLAPEIHEFLQQQISLPDSDIAGTALVILSAWKITSNSTNDQANTMSPEILSRAVQIAADATRSVDVRVTALHVASSHATDLSRTLAIDSTQPMLVRKAAIACIGRHGSKADLANLEILRSENPRLAKAAEPARAAIDHRLANPNAPTPIPF